MRPARIAGRVASPTLIGAPMPALVPAAAGQMARPGVFVTNNGNNEGAITSFGLAPDGALVLLDRIGDGVLDFFDFLEFQDEFAAGCP